jgi:hypothetical protein
VGRTADLRIFLESKDDRDDIAEAKFVYGCKSGGCLVVVGSHEEMAKRLREYESIGRIVVLGHGGPGVFAFGGVFMNFPTFADLLKGTKLKVTKEIVFEACTIGENPTAVLSLIEVLKAPQVVAYNAFHALDSVAISKGDDVKALEQNLTAFRTLLLPNQPSPAEILRQGGGRLFLEWWRHDTDRRLPAPEDIGHHAVGRAQLQNKIVPGEAAAAAAHELNDIGAPMFRVIIMAPAKAAPGQKGKNP